MPLDFDALFAPFRVAFHIQWRSIGESFCKVAEWLTKRLKTTKEREIGTRNIQAFDFTGSALSIWIDASQHGKLGPRGEPPPSGFVATIAAPFKSFWHGLLLATAMIESEETLPGIIDALSRFVDIVTASTDRFKEPGRYLFDPKVRKRWDDLFGELALFFRLVNDPETVKQVQAFSSGTIDILGVIKEQFPSRPAAEGETSAGLSGLSRWALGATLAIPVAVELARNLARTAGVTARFPLVDWASSALKKVFRLRRDVIDFVFGTAFGYGTWALEMTVSIYSDILYAVKLYTAFAGEYVEQVQAWLKATGKDLKTFMDGVVRFLYGLGAYLDKVMDIDFGKAVTGGISVSLAELLDLPNHPDKVKLLQGFIAYEAKKHQILAFLLYERGKALIQLIGIFGTKTPFPEEAAPPDLSTLARPPQIYEAFFGDHRADALRKSLTELGPGLQEKVGSIFDAGGDILTKLGDTMHQAAADAVNLGSTSSYRRVAQSAERISEAAFGSVAASAAFVPKPSPIASAYAAWLAGSGFQMIESVFPAYVAEMISFWKKEAAKPPTERPTSPHILARRAQLERVKVPRMIVRVGPGRELDKSLAVDIADRVRSGVAQAFNLGDAKLAGAQ